MTVRVMLIIAVFAAVVATAAWADVVHLKSGGRLEGVVKVEGDTLTITNRFGSTSVPVSAVELVEKAPTILEKYEKLASKADANNVAAQRRLAEFCRENHLRARERYHLLLILRLRPDNIEARSRLGFVMHKGKWHTKADEMFDRGLTRFRGQWVTPEAKQATLAAERERRRELAAKRRREREERLAMLRAKKLARARKARQYEPGRTPVGVMGIQYRDQYRDPYDPYGYYGYGGRYSLTSPYYGGYCPNPYWNSNWGWYRRWTGVGLSGEYRSRDWRIRWGGYRRERR